MSALQRVNAITSKVRNSQSFIDKISDLLLSPFTKFLPFTILLTILASFSGVVQGLSLRDFKGPLVHISINLAVACAVVLPLNIRNKIFAWIWRTIILILYIIFSIVDVASRIYTYEDFNSDTAAIISETNISEASEFISLLISWKFFGPLLILILVSISALFICRTLQKRMKRGLAFCGVLIGVFAALWSIRVPIILYKNPIGKLIICCKVEPAPNLKEYPTNPIVSPAELLPDNVVIIIGESHSSLHSSLYGYEKNTNPNLEKLRSTSSLYVFPNVKAAEYHTIQSLKLMLTTCNSLENEDSQWINKHRLTEMLHNAGFYTRWLSNQGSKGLFDNIGQRFAMTCDTTYFSSKFLSSLSHDHPYDDSILEMLEENSASEISPCADFIHLLGSHQSFAERYPSSYNIFNEVDYPNRNKEQAMTLATYDNSLLYNDFIVSSIISHYFNKSACIIYLSDHSLDLYDSNLNIASHAVSTDSISAYFGRKVPFMIFLSDKLREQNPEIEKRTIEMLNKEIDLRYLPEIILNLLNINLEN